MAQCFLILENGTIMEGTGFGSEKTVYGEVVFNTAMTGYQESLTDPSYRGQILIAAHPVIGNYGTHQTYFESPQVQVSGYVVREACREPSPMYGSSTLDSFLKSNEIPGISEVDTRSLIIGIREHGVLRGAITYEEDLDEVLEKVRKMPFPSEYNLVDEVSPRQVTYFQNPRQDAKTVALIDCGCKEAIMRELSRRFNVYRVPYNTTPDFFRNTELDGVAISNGPGDPAHPAMKETTIKTIQAIKDEYPIMGVCLGNQLLALAFGGRTYKMKFGHRGVNQPVKYRDRVYITSQNHGFVVDEESLPDTGFIPEHLNINDNTVDGMSHSDLPIFSTQYHPEACAGPKDTSFIFDDFAKLMEERR